MGPCCVMSDGEEPSGGQLVDDLGMLTLQAGNVDNVQQMTAAQRSAQQFHGPAPYRKGDVPRDTYGVPVSTSAQICVLCNPIPS